jgi:hypothetical protein
VVLAGFKPVAGRREETWVGSIPTRLRQQTLNATGKKDSLKRLARFALVILFAGAARLCIAQDTKPQTISPPAPNQTPESNPKSWKEFVSREGVFTVLLPGTPMRHSQQTESPAGPQDYFTYTLQTQAAAYFIAYVDFPEVPNDERGVQKILDGGRDGAVATINGKLISETDISLKTIPGRALAVEGATELLKARIYLAGLRLYLVMIVANKDQLASPETSSLFNASVERYFGSFKVTTKKK